MVRIYSRFPIWGDGLFREEIRKREESEKSGELCGVCVGPTMLLRVGGEAERGRGEAILEGLPTSNPTNNSAVSYFPENI